MIRFELVTLEGTKFSEDVYEVVLPTPQGYIGVFPFHIPIVSIACPGVISVRHKQTDRDDQMEYFATNGGVIEVEGNNVKVLADEADHEAEINEQEAQKAFEQAQKLRAEAKDQVELNQAQNLIDRHAVRLKVAELKRHRKSRF